MLIGDRFGSDRAGGTPDGRAAAVGSYGVCERITAEQARNFAYGIRLLPPTKRRAMSAIYAFARRIDDIADMPERRAADGGVAAPDGKLGRLAAARDALHRLGSPTDDPVLVALDDAARRFPLPLPAFDELIDGVEMDVRGVRYPDFAALTGYCRRVAGSIGRLSVGVYGAADPGEAERLADVLGLALQQTNILRDIGEDLAAGRLYLPADELAAYGIEVGADGELAPARRLAELVRFAARRAARSYDEGLTLLRLLDRRSAACTAAMAGIYRRLLDRIAADPGAVVRERVSLPTWEKAAVAITSLTDPRKLAGSS
jgi:phytoene synthase